MTGKQSRQSHSSIRLFPMLIVLLQLRYSPSVSFCELSMSSYIIGSLLCACKGVLVKDLLFGSLALHSAH